MKQVLLLLAIFVVAFAATLLLTRDAFKEVRWTDRVEVADEAATPDAVLRQRRADIDRTMISPSTPDAGGAPAVDVGAAAQPALGEVEGVVKSDDGLVPSDLKVTVHPEGAEVRHLGGGRFAVDKLTPGLYLFGASAEGYLPRQHAEVEVEGGRRKAIELALEKGFEIRGIVFEDTDQRPIQGARIDFNGMAEVISDARGTFRTGFVSPKALDLITLSHDDYDRTQMVRPPMPDVQQISLAMSRGKGTVSGRVSWPSGVEAPGSFRVRVWRLAGGGHEELRRERTLTGTSAFEIRGVFDGANVLEVAFPGTVLATRRIEFDLNREAAIHVDVDFNQGGSIEGTFTTPSMLVALQPVMLLDGENHTMGETRTDSEGKFRFDSVTAGDYSIRMDVGIPQIRTGTFTVEAHKVKPITIDGATGRLK